MPLNKETTYLRVILGFKKLIITLIKKLLLQLTIPNTNNLHTVKQYQVLLSNWDNFHSYMISSIHI